MKLFINICEFGIIELSMRNDETIKEIKQNIHGKRGLNVNLLNLYYNGEILDDEKTLDKYEIINNSIINIVNKLSGGMRIFVENNKKIFAFEIDENERIIDAKLKIFKSIGIDDKYFYLVYHDKIFDGDENLIEFGISNKSLINVESIEMHIFAKTMTGQTYIFEVTYSEKIIDLKFKIQELIGFHPNEQTLIYLTTLLDDDKSIDEYQIIDQSIIYVICKLRDEMKISAKTIDGKFVTFEVQKLEKINNIKKKIQEKIGLHKDEQILNYEGEILDDDKTIDEYQICDQSVINIVTRLSVIQIFVKSINEEIIKIYVYKSNKIKDIKYEIKKKIDIHQNDQMIYKNVILEDEKTINEYQICDQSVIIIINKFKIEILINLEIFGGQKFKLYAENQTKIIEIKKQIEFLTHLHLLKQNLYYQGALLGNEITLKEIETSLEGTSQLNINKKRPFIKKIFKSRKKKSSNVEMTISVELNNDWLEIFVETANKIQHKLCVFKNEIILDVKWKIHQVIYVEPDEQILFYNESILEDNKTVEQSNIIDEAVLRVEFKLKT